MIWRVLCYHGINENEAENFEKQIRFFIDSGWEFCNMTDAIYLKQLNKEGKYATITFDDGQESLFENAIPILEKLNIKACFYITTDYVLKGNTYRDREPMLVMTWDQIVEISKKGHEIGSHSHTHIRFTTIDECGMRNELRISKEMLEDRLQHEIKHFAYPHGQHNQETYGVLLKTRYYQTAATIERGSMEKNDALLIKRNAIYPEWSINKIKLYNRLGDNELLYNLVKLRRLIAKISFSYI